MLNKEVIMVNKSTWLRRFNDLLPKSQLEVASFIVKVIVLNENEDYSKEKYDKEKSLKVRELFKILETELDNKDKLEAFSSIVERFNQLSYSDQVKVIDSVYKNFVKSVEKVELSHVKSACQMEGHKYGKWKKRTWTTKELYWDAGPQGYVDVEHEVWVRTCSRCGKEQIVKNKPKELVKEEKEAAKEAEIKQLRKRLKELGEE